MFIRISESHMRHHRASLLGQPTHIQHRTGLARDMRCHGQYLPDGDHTGAADSSDKYAKRLRE